jgi:quinol monooxygenase YgiN
MNEPYYTHAVCRVIPGNETKFVEAWKRMADEFRALPTPPMWGRLIQSTDDPKIYYSIGAWHNMSDIDASRKLPRAVDAMNKVRDLCTEFNRVACKQIVEVTVEQHVQ